jgi:hypothetical protein
MISAKGNSGREKSPSPKSVMMFKGIKGLVASGPGMTKIPDTKKLRPEGKVHIDAGNLKPATGMKKTAAGSPKSIRGGSVNVSSHIRPEGGIKRDSASVIKP